MASNEIILRGENYDGDTTPTVRDGNYLYPDGEIRFGHSFPCLISVLIQTGPTTGLHLWDGDFNITSGVVYNLRDDIFDYTCRWYADLLGVRNLQILIQELDAPGGSVINSWYVETPIDVLNALPEPSTYYFDIIPNFTLDNEVFRIETVIYNMDSDSQAIVVIDGKTFKLLTTDDYNYYTDIDASLLSTFLLKKVTIIAINSGGVIFWPEVPENYWWMGNAAYSSGVVDIQSWPDSDSLLNWDKVGNFSLYEASRYLAYVVMDMDESEETYWAKTISDIKLSSPFRFQTEFGASGVMYENDEEIYFGLFGSLVDYQIMERFIGIRLFVDAGDLKLEAIIIDDDYNTYSQEFGVIIENWSSNYTIYSIQAAWNPDTRKYTLSMYKTDPADEASLVETIEIKLDSIPVFTMDKWGVHAGHSGISTSEGRIYLGNTLLHVGAEGDLPQVVDEVIFDNGYKPTDLQIIARYYDFITGDYIIADDNLTVEIIDSENTVVETLTAFRRTDNRYEAYWDTTGVTKDSYKVKVIAEINGKTFVSEKWVSVQNE